MPASLVVTVEQPLRGIEPHGKRFCAANAIDKVKFLVEEIERRLQ